MSRIYDQPGHPCYGPARRLHIMLLQLMADRTDGMVVLDRMYSEEGVHSTWDSELAWFIHVGELHESDAQRIIMKRCLRSIS